ncbi:hypothetical protein L6164_021833 [Bauhinia variegata]|uniref:Uncharacterized protein n=1 Tax=Bauhinia variegata TaxID=167791 RepID=A0ACB9MER9_BAUVA|nr:hypothetical protein L6164_021833 [Bauhinia variegata]
MSGGFFRGTSADQDTRFSNKQAKLLKSQKFAPELEHLVDMTKVNMEVIKPWITRRVTELLGFEDEVLINFIHGLLDAKEVNGKEVQIQITGFMEKNTGKFMKELWTLLLSAQKNASGVPQQFLDAKEEELRKKKVENDRITSEIQKKKDREGREVMQQRLMKMEGGFDSKDPDTASHPALKSRYSGDYVPEKKDADKRNGVRAMNRSPHSPAVSTSPHRDSPSGSMSKSFSNSRSYSGDRHRPRSISRSPKVQGRSPRRGSPWQSPSPHRRSSYSKRRSRSRSHYRSPSPVRRRLHSPFPRRSPSPSRQRKSPSPSRRRRSPSPSRRRRSPPPSRRQRSPPPRRRRSPPPSRRPRSPPLRRLRSPSPVRRHRSPSPLRRHRSPSPIRRGSPSLVRHRSPLPVHQMSPVPLKRRSSSPMQSPSLIRRRYRSRTPQHRFPSPLRHRSPVNKRLPSLSTQRSPSPNEWSSQSPVQHSSPSQDGRKTPRRHRSPVLSSREKARMQERSPEARQSFSPLRSLQRDKHCNSLHHQSEDSHSTPEKSPIVSAAPRARNSVSSEDRRSSSLHGSPRRQRGVKLASERSSSLPKKRRHDNSETSEGTEEMCHSRGNRDHKTKSLRNESKYSSSVSKQKDLPAKYHTKDEISPKRAAGHMSSESHGRYDKTDLRKKGQEVKSGKSSGRGGHPETLAQQKSPMYSERTCESYAVDSKKSEENNQIHLNHVKDGDQHCKSDGAQVDHVTPSVSYDSGSEESDKHRREDKDRKKHKRSERKVVYSDEEYSYDSELEKRKESKRRKREERKLRKEERRQRREERRRKREERRAEKLKIKGKADYYTSDNEAERMHPQQSDKKD